jgi:UDP-3-O-[3-hydroxymyristoyl] glucosamine N-acyltransferase
VTLTVRQLADWVGGEVVGDPATAVRNPAALGDAEPGDFSFVADGEKNLKAWAGSKAAAAFVPASFPADPRPVIKVADPLAAFIQVVQKLRGVRPEAREVHPTAVIHPTAKLGPNASVGPHAVVGEGTTIGANATLRAGCVVGRFCTVGDDFTLHPNATLYDDCKVGHRVTVHSGAVIGADGFGYRLVKGRHEKVPQLGWVELGDDVEIGANTTVDRGAVGPTRVGEGTKIDNLVMVAHNCRLGRHNILVSQCGIAGSCSTGDYVVMAGQAGTADHIRIGDRAVLGAQCGVISDIPADTEVIGSPAVGRREYFRLFAGMQKIGDLRDDLKALKKQVAALEAREGKG